ncbi:alpha/beta hydrolase [Rhodoblastus acidophilus]|uniref:Alpha/beta hydrolase n=1 Tax=Candidatus Rhodoblastus alkanivorans TaxID=2954117 RepID=A0ABS9Z6V1_9HYPH|nr:alpha/beta fold hydrolase [Candidatus Rhodoblastus alkanivorans]MCI4678405.1 alpha/beta hydrolase [Candidatus Rhodoblastus alkanivorans]MCI4682922.1 alpha/beta hydrolase [Candidatus Rhodoblastus alkanivorans]MDI4640232.1 alpha/beta hydrolase [Rhodoblastus acidophilus]
MRVSDLDILIVPGLGGSGPDHWQSRWAQKLSTARLVEQDDWVNPARDAWVAAILREIDAAARPVALVGHSLGSLAAASAIAETPAREKIAAAFLVAPPDPDAEKLPPGLIDPAFKEKAPQTALGVPGVLVASRNDSFADYAFAEQLAQQWGLDLADAGEAGHINAESGHGPWPEGLMRLAGLFSRLSR